MPKKVAVIPGDGIGPEIISSAVAVLNTLASDIELVNIDAGYDCYKRTGAVLSRRSIDLIDRCDAVLVGCIEHPDNDRLYRDPLTDIKRRLDLYAEVRTVRKIVPDIGDLNDINAVFINENDDGFFNISEIEELDGATLSKKTSYIGTKRICQFARKFMEENGRKRITCVHKTDLYKITDGLFLNTFRSAMEGSDFIYDDMRADEMASYLMHDSRNVDVVVSSNPYSDILSEEAGALAGGTHLIPISYLGDEKGMFKPLHRAHSSLAGLNLVNPTAELMCAANMLSFLGYPHESSVLNEAIRSTYKRGFRTADMGGDTGTFDFTMEVVKICEETQ